MNSQVNTGSGLPPPYIPFEVIHYPDHRTYHSVGDHVASSARQRRLIPSVLDDTLRACAYLGETFSSPPILAYVE